MKLPFGPLRPRLRLLRRYLEWQWVRVCDGLALLGSGPPRATDDVLIVKLDAIGDFVLWLDAAKELRRLYSRS
jgi:hypothetical protein